MADWEALDALSHQLELCGVDAQTRLVVLVDPNLDAELISPLRVAVARSLAEAVEIRISPHRCPGNEPLTAALEAADLVITTGAHHGQGAEGAQLLHVHPMRPDRFSPRAGLRQRVNTLVSLIGDANTLAVTDDNGTQLTIELAASVIDFDHGFVDANTGTASFPAGWVSVVPTAATVHGQLVLMPGDGNLAAEQLISSPVVLELVDDHIAVIEGDSPDADVVRALLEHAGQATAYGIAGCSIGLNPESVTTPAFDSRLLDPVVSKLLAGVVQISFGANLVADRPCRQTISMALPGRTVHLDELPIVATGQLLGDIEPDVYEL